ncbi:MAG: hypothetical protein AUK44_09115 [Porphyromonadaceae bacterium CG2_30_38_12]|nr:MAG: hypothetical protein AUK44_09115 [Porphyromonadaceae bacterium CG2_30_38_12]
MGFKNNRWIRWKSHLFALGIFYIGLKPNADKSVVAMQLKKIIKDYTISLTSGIATTDFLARCFNLWDERKEYFENKIFENIS